MMFEKGDKVICIHAHVPLVIGQEYTVRDATPFAVWVDELPTGWAYKRFTKVEDMALPKPIKEDFIVKPTIVLNAKAKPKEVPKPKKEKGKYLPVEQFVDSHLYQNFLKYEDGNKVVEAYNAIKHVYAEMEFDHQRKNLLAAKDINNALTWADWEIVGWDWCKCFERCTKNKQKALAEAKKAKQAEKAL